MKMQGLSQFYGSLDNYKTTDQTAVPATSQCGPVKPVHLPSLYLVQVECWDEQIFKVVSVTDSCWSCGGQDDDLS